MLRIGILLILAVAIGGGCTKKKGNVRVGDKVPAISAVDLDDNKAVLADYMGKILIVQFWQDACCAEQLPVTEAVIQKYADQGVKAVGLNIEDSAEAIRTAMRAYNITFPTLRDRLGITAKRFGVHGLPTYFIVDQNGVVKYRILGNATFKHMEKKILSLLKNL